MLRSIEHRTAETPVASTVHEPLGNPAGPGLFRVKGLQLPAYVQHVAHHLEAMGHPESSAVHIALGVVQDWAAGHDGHGHQVHPDVQAAAAKAVAQWEADKAAAHAGDKGRYWTRAEHVPGTPYKYKHGWIPAAGGGGALSDAEYAAHTQRIEQTLRDALARGDSTDARYGIDVDKGIWQPGRAELHKQIVNDLYRRQSAGVPSDGEAVIAGGLGGAGKSTVLKGPAGIDPKRYITLNPDDVKEEMVRRGLVPEVKGLSPMEASALIHEESSHIANLLAKMAYAERKNVIWDITMSSRGSVQRRIEELRAAGYKNLRGVFVDIPVEKSVERALARHRRGMSTPEGGRYVPPSIIRKNASSKASSANREVFDALRHLFDHWALYDNSGSAPRRVAESRRSLAGSSYGQTRHGYQPGQRREYGPVAVRGAVSPFTAWRG